MGMAELGWQARQRWPRDAVYVDEYADHSFTGRFPLLRAVLYAAVATLAPYPASTRPADASPSRGVAPSGGVTS